MRGRRDRTIPTGGGENPGTRTSRMMTDLRIEERSSSALSKRQWQTGTPCGAARRKSLYHLHRSEGDKKEDLGSEPVKLSEASPPPTGWKWLKTSLLLIFPYLAHLVMIATSCALILGINGHQFSTIARTGTITLSDGSTVVLPFYLPLQSDITTAISFVATITRVAASLWIGGMAWRCFFLFMAKGGISTHGAKRMLGGWPLLPGDMAKGSNLALFTLILIFINWGSNLFSPILTGSVSWTPSSIFVIGEPSSIKIRQMDLDYNFTRNIRDPSTLDDIIIPRALIKARQAWGFSGQPSSKFLTRVLDEDSAVPAGFRLKDCPIPFFAVDRFEWINDPAKEVTLNQLSVALNVTGPNPLTRGTDRSLALIPDNGWGIVDGPESPEPHTVSETRILVLEVYEAIEPSPGPPYSSYNGKECNGSDIAAGRGEGDQAFADTIPWANVRGLIYRLNYPDPLPQWQCHVFARVSYRAGVAICPDCRAIQPTLVQYNNETSHPPVLSADTLTKDALAVAPRVSLAMSDSYARNAWPRKFNGAQEYATEELSRSYQIAWAALIEWNGRLTRDISVEAGIPTSSVSVTKWRVWLWAALHAVALLIGVLFFIFYPSPWIDAPNLAALLIDTDEFRTAQGWKGDPWKADTEIPSGVLTLSEEGDSNIRHRRVTYRPTNEPVD